MSRPLRIEYAGAIYHVMSRGNAGADIVRDDRDREQRLHWLARTVDEHGWRLHAFVLGRGTSLIVAIRGCTERVRGMPPDRRIRTGWLDLPRAQPRGNGRMRLFHKDADFAAFQDVVAEGLPRYPVYPLTYCLMS